MRPNPNDQVAADLYATLGRYVRSRVSHPADAEDVLQDIFVKLLASDGPSETSRLLPWVFAVARNRIIDFYRERDRQPVVLDRAPEARSEVPDEVLVDLRGALKVLIEQLSEHDQDVLRAVDLNGMSQKEYADALGLNYVTAKSRIQRTRKRFRRKFDRCCTIVRDRRGAPIECTLRHRSLFCEAC